MPHAQPPTSSAKVSLFVWHLAQNLSRMFGPTSSGHAAAGMAFLSQTVSYTVFAPNCLFVLNALCSSGPLPFTVVGESN
jgi:hypothetical protein